MEDFTYPEPEEKPPWWFRVLPKGLQMLIVVHELKKMLEDPELPQKIEEMKQFNKELFRSMRALQGEDDGENENLHP